MFTIFIIYRNDIPNKKKRRMEFYFSERLYIECNKWNTEEDKCEGFICSSKSKRHSCPPACT